jgi:hypothetical protein
MYDASQGLTVTTLCYCTFVVFHIASIVAYSIGTITMTTTLPSSRSLDTHIFGSV